MGIRCAACLAAKASTCSTGAQHEYHDTPTPAQLQQLAEQVNGTYNKQLKRSHVERGDCVLTDHYISAVPS